MCRIWSPSCNRCTLWELNLSSDLFLGVDGGQSSTKALIGDPSGRVVGRGTAGPCNHVSGEEARSRFVRTISECVSKARADAGLGGEIRFRSACFGMSGGPEDKAALLKEVVDAEQWLVTHDGLIALSGALAGANGVVAIAGTGSLVFARHGPEAMRAGGWGYLFGDEGSAFWIAKQAVRAALRHEEGWGVKTTLYPRLLDATGAKSANEALHFFYTPGWDRSRVARLAVVVNDIAESGDAVAVEILRQAGDLLAESVGAVRSKLWKSGQPVTASYIGGVFRSAAVLLRFSEALWAGWNVEVRPPVWGGEAGALIEAYRLAGLPTNLRDV
jgi:N-acetylglucosamine kinase-like BadF-type ATPase